MTFLIDGENVIKRFGQARIKQVKLYLAAAAMFLIPAVYYIYFSKIILPVPDIYFTAILAAIGIILILIAELKTRLGSYYITNFRVISIMGAMKKTMDSCTYDKMVNVKIEQTFIQRLLRMGTIDITTYQKTEMRLKSVSNPTKIEKLIYSAMEKQSNQQRAPERRESQQPQYQEPLQQPQYQTPVQKPEYASQPQPGNVQPQNQYQDRPLLASERRQQPAYEQQTPIRTQNRPLLASEREETHQPQPQRYVSQPSRKKRFKFF